MFRGASIFNDRATTVMCCGVANKGAEAMKIVQVKMDDELVAGIESYRKRQPGAVPAKTQAIRELLRAGILADLEDIASEAA
jgi:hypothetical protein